MALLARVLGRGFQPVECSLVVCKGSDGLGGVLAIGGKFEGLCDGLELTVVDKGFLPQIVSLRGCGL